MFKYAVRVMSDQTFHELLLQSALQWTDGEDSVVVVLSLKLALVIIMKTRTPVLLFEIS